MQIMTLKNFYQQDLSQADYIFCYLLADDLNQLALKFKKELKPGAIIISNTFAIKDWTPEQKIVLDPDPYAGLNRQIFIYKI